MEWFIENWFIIVGLIALIVCIGFVGIKFLGLPTNDQVKKIKVFLLKKVVDAEKELGSKTGRLKLSMVYDAFISKFPMTAKFISFETFSKYVDVALEEMEDMLETNKKVVEFIESK
jgi:hypothetical protein